MKKKIYILSILIGNLIFHGCDYCIQLKGRVLSNKNDEPIREAQITLKSRNITVVTDSLGFFYLQDCGGGRCPKPIYVVSKEGYKDFEMEFRSMDSGDGIIVKTGQKNYDLGGKYFYPDSMNSSTYLAVIAFEKYSKDYAKRGDSVIFYMDIDNEEANFENFLRNFQNGRWDIR